MLAGISGVAPITKFDPSGLPTIYACEVKNFNAVDFMDAAEVRRADQYEHFAVAAAKLAVQSANLSITPTLSEETAVVIGSSVGGHKTLVAENDVLREKGVRRINPFIVPMFMHNGAAGMVAIALKAQGPSYSPVSACATSNDSIGQAFDLVRYGKCTVAFGGGADATVAKLGMAGFAQIGALSKLTQPPIDAPRPFDKRRDGVVVGEGACVLVLEELEFAKARGANILAEMVGYGQTTDAYHIIAPSEGGAGAARAMKRALDDAQLEPTAIDYINAHGTATPLNDVSESLAIKSVFGDYAYKIPVSSTKSMTGHCMGVAGAIEAAACISAINSNIVPPTINLTDPDIAVGCDLDYVPLQARHHTVKIAMNNSFGFGGHNSVTIFKRYEG
jgi:beta-ketoacyl-acyl-carrier-protein synthase II